MRSVVVQSYRTESPDWLQVCMRSVKDWALQQGHEYQFVDDRLFDYVPAQVMRAPPSTVLPLTDLARLGLLKDLLNSGYDRAIWVDADVLVFRPEHFRIPDVCGGMLCREVWTYEDEDGQIKHRPGINNAVAVFDRGHPLLDFLHHAALELFAQLRPEQIHSSRIGTDFYTLLGRIYPMRLLTQVGCFSPIITRALLSGERTDLLREYGEQFGHPFHAVNLCRFKLIDDSVLGELDRKHIVTEEHLLTIRSRTIEAFP